MLTESLGHAYVSVTTAALPPASYRVSRRYGSSGSTGLLALHRFSRECAFVDCGGDSHVLFHTEN